jgi:hypothetical protein
MAGRGKIIELHVAITGSFEFQLSTAELLVLHVQLDLADLQFMREVLYPRDWHGRDILFGHPQQLLRLTV